MSPKREHASKYDQMNIGEVLEELSTDSEQGLTQDEATSRLEKYGENTIEEEEKNPVVVFLSHF